MNAPSTTTPFGGSIALFDGSDLAALRVDDVIEFVPTEFTTTSKAEVSRLANWSRLNGVLLAVNLRSTTAHRIEGSAVMVAPGVDSFAIIRSYLATLRKQGRNVFAALTCVFHHKIPDPLGA